MRNPTGRLARTLALVVLLDGACVTTPASSTPAAVGGYLYAAPTEVIFVQWDAAGAAGSGTVRWQRPGAEATTADFTVAWSEGAFSFRFEPGSLAGWTGRLADDGLQLVIPADTGGLRDIALRPASLSDFDELAAAVR